MRLEEDLQMADVPLWSGLDSAARQELQTRLERVSVPGGEVLFEEGQIADALYILVSGALGISVRNHEGEERRLARIFPPETIGEMALISDAPRSATVTALRDSVLLKLSRFAYDELIERCPHAMLYLARLLADRLRAANRSTPLAYAPATFAIVPVTQGVSVPEFADALFNDMRQRFGPRVTLLGHMPAEADEEWFHRVEVASSRVLYASAQPVGDWTELCIRRADHIILVAKPGEPVERLPRSLISGRGWRRRDLVLLQDAHVSRPKRAHASLEELNTDLRLHVRRGDPHDLQRVARIISGKAVGIVFAGGGARGFAHVGVMQALREHNYPIDLVGGTSIGAVIAAACARDSDYEGIRGQLAAAFAMDPPLSDYTLPLVALVRGRKVDRRLLRHFGGYTIEDLWLPFFCVSSNLTTGNAYVHTRGPLWRALRASIAIPGLLPPVIEQDGVLVDGALMNNLPADIMARLQRGPVLAVDVAQDMAFPAGRWNRKRSVLRRLLGVPAEAPDIVSLLYRSATVSGDAQTARARSLATAIIHPPLADIELRAWHRFDEVVEIGYRHAKQAIEAGALAGIDV